MPFTFDTLAYRPRFVGDERERFRLRQESRSTLLLRVALIVSAIAYFDFLTWDLYLGAPQQAMPLRIVASALCLTLLALTYTDREGKRLAWWYSAYALLFAVTLSTMLALSPLSFEKGLPGILFYVVSLLAISPFFGWTVAAYLLLLAITNLAMVAVDVPPVTMLIGNAFLVSWLVTAGAIAYYFDLRRRFDFRVERERERERKTLKRLATVDTLTGVANRRYFLSLLKREMERSRRHHHPLSVAMLDIDHFKRINDTYGHDAGDRCLKAFCAVIAKRIRISDHFGRLGGEEFALIFPETGLKEAARSVESLRRRLETMNMTLNGRRIVLTMSAGVTEWTPGDPSVDEPLKRADALLYQAKSEGRNRVMTKEGPVAPKT